MKTLGRILIILAAFLLVMGLVYVVVNANSSSTTVLAFERGGEGFPRPEGLEPQFSNGERPEVPDGDRHEFGRARQTGGGWMFGLFKNIAVIGIIVALIIALKSMVQSRRKRAAPVPAIEPE